VAVGSEAGETSAVAVSGAFDVHYSPGTILQEAWVTGSNTLNARWDTWSYTDVTPDDPLDRDDTVMYSPTYQIGTAAAVSIGKPISAMTFSFAGPKPPYDFYVRSANEWAQASDSERAQVRASSITASIPSWVVANNNTVISGTYTGLPAAKVTLQARNSASSAWYVVASTDFTGNKYKFAIPSVVTRQYRVALPNRSTGVTAWLGGYSGAKTTTVQQKVTTTGSETVYRRYSPSQMSVYINPALDGQVALQRWNGKTWVLVDLLNVRFGWVNRWIPTTVLGSFTYRIYSPNQVYRGSLVAAAYSPNFVITIKP
jgi:hypothetical protein